MRKILALTLVGVLIVGATAFSFADTFKSPLNILSGLTGLTSEEVYEQRLEDQTLVTWLKRLAFMKHFKQHF